MSHVKIASSLAKDNRYNDAITTLDSFYSKNDASTDELIKVIPYYQKAGRYIELNDYCEKVIIPKLKIHNALMFSHKCQEVQNAFLNLALHKMYAKLSLCAKRESLNSDLEMYSSLSTKAFEEYQNYLKLGENVESQKEFEKLKELFGLDPSDWPNTLRERYQSFFR